MCYETRDKKPHPHFLKSKLCGRMRFTHRGTLWLNEFSVYILYILYRCLPARHWQHSSHASDAGKTQELYEWLHLSHETAGSKIMGNCNSPVFHILTVCSHFCHLTYTGPLGGQVSAPTEGPLGLARMDFTHAHREKREQGPLNPSVRHLYVRKQDVGG